ncbi:MAG: beta strand repeat-containing protein, partial [Flavobacteriales bacterium]
MKFLLKLILLNHIFFSAHMSFAQSSIIDVVTHSDIVTDSDNIVGNGDVVVFTTKVTNISNITISSLTISNSLVGIDGSVLSLSSPITFVNNSGSSSEGDLIAGEVSTYVSTYTFDSSGVAAGGISLTVSGTASTPGNTNNVIDGSDDGDDSDGNIINDPTQVIVNNTITLVEGTKVENYIDYDSNGSIGFGDQLEYIITVYNNGEEDLENIELFDILKDLNDNTLALVAPFTPPGPIFVSSDQGSINSNILVGETVTYKAVYLVQQGAVDSGGLNNCLDVQVDGVNSGRRFTDTADNGNDSDGNLINDCTASTITATPSLEVTKSASVQDVNGNSLNDPNDIINYTIRIENDGDLTLTGLVIDDTFVDGNGNSISLNSVPAFSNSSLGSSEGTLQVGEVAIYTAAYTISLNSANSGSVSNSLLVTASSPGQSNNVSDTSDDGIQDDGNIIDDPTITTLSINKKIEATKTFSITDNGDGQNGQGDVVTYTINIENTGQINVSGITLVDQLTNCDGSSILNLSSGPTWNSNSGSSAQGSLDPGEIASYTATYNIGSVEIDSGCILNTVTATASSPGSSNDITDVSDDGNDNDGNLVNDKTQIDFSVDPDIEATKTGVLVDNGNDLPGAGDTAVFTIDIVNTGNTALSTITLSDTFTRLDGTALTLDSGPTFNSSSGGSAQGTLQSGESATYTASYTVDADDVTTNAVVNQVIVSAEAFNGTVITDVSDDG